MKYVRTGRVSANWLKFGGGTTLYDVKENSNILAKLDIYFKKAKYYHLEGSKFFCHGGFNPKRPINKQKNINFAINRQMYNTAMRYDKQQLKFDVKYSPSSTTIIREIYVGHSTTKTLKPSFLSNLINVDTGAGSNGVLTLMNVKSKEYVQSPLVSKLYKNEL
jgi:serine/threonine protein phosphatase 1